SLLVTSSTRIYTLSLHDALPISKSVFLAGDFNNWSPDGFPMEKMGDEWVLKVHLSPGKHLYKYIVDGKWIIDPTNKLWEQNEHRSEEHTSELQSRENLVCRLLLE